MTSDIQTYTVEVAERYICDSLVLWAMSTTASDLWVLDRIMADDLVWFDDDGRERTKQDALDELKASHYVGTVRIDYVTVEFNGDTAIAWASETWKSGDESGRLLAVTTWKFRDGQWLLVRSEDKPIPPIDSSIDQEADIHLVRDAEPVLRDIKAYWEKASLREGASSIENVLSGSHSVRAAKRSTWYEVDGNDGNSVHLFVNKEIVAT